MWQAVVLITKAKKDYRGIGLVEVMWKVVSEILNRRLTASITFHDFLHEFWAGHGTGTSTLKDKLIQQLEALMEEVLYMIFLDLHKGYDRLDRSRCLEILGDTAWDPNPGGSSQNTEGGSQWWQGRVAITGRRSRERAERRREIRSPPLSLM